MNNVNFDALMQEQAQHNRGKRLLLHCCCAPCASACIERLKEYFDITVLFYNPNILPKEYERRKAELVRFVTQTGWAKFMDCEYDPKVFNSAVCGLEREPEGGARCEKCFLLRLAYTERAARENGFDFFTTTLTVSPLKDSKKINEIGESLNKDLWLYSDFKKRNGYLESTKLSKEYGLYRQNYCGCAFSLRENR